MKSGGNQYVKSITANIIYIKIIHLVVIVVEKQEHKVESEVKEHD